ncbi:oxygen-insensitive NAD(P)H nitroreductase [Psychrobacter sp. NG254]|nr:oxygen-insensitive NAD(P)H nitroreductase [Psychrobacter sp. NG254]
MVLKAIDDEFDLRSKGYSTMAVISFDYRHEDDFNSKISKSRLSEEVIFAKA